MQGECDIVRAECRQLPAVSQKPGIGTEGSSHASEPMNTKTHQSEKDHPYSGNVPIQPGRLLLPLPSECSMTSLGQWDEFRTWLFQCPVRCSNLQFLWFVRYRQSQGQSVAMCEVVHCWTAGWDVVAAAHIVTAWDWPYDPDESAGEVGGVLRG